MNKNRKIVIGICSIVLIGILYYGFSKVHLLTARKEQSTISKNSDRVSTKTATQKDNMRTMTGNYYLYSSQLTPYPNIKNYQGTQLQLSVNINKQRTYLIDKNNGKILYTFYCSTGKDNTTPKGQYKIEAERGDHFYNTTSDEGANYWTSWKDHGIYLFHSVPVDHAGNYIQTEGNELGKKPMSHGCVRLSVSDAKWLNANIPFATSVVIK